MTPILFVTGTDTGVGKTVVACGIARLLARSGRAIRALKPVETGCAGAGETLRAEDAERLSAATGERYELGWSHARAFALPAAPSVAARHAGETLSVAALAKWVQERAEDVDLCVVEGAGGLLVPIGPDGTMADLALQTRAELLVVAPDRLGVLNHVCLTADVAKTRGLRIRTIVLNSTGDGNAPERQLEELRSLLPHIPYFIELPRLPSVGAGAVADAIVDALAVAGLTPESLWPTG